MAGWLGGCGGGEPRLGRDLRSSALPGLKIAMIAKSATNPIFASARKGAEAAAKSCRRSTACPSRSPG